MIEKKPSAFQITKLCREIFSTKISKENVPDLIQSYASQAKDPSSFFSRITSELMELKRTSVYLNSEPMRRDIYSSISGYLKFQNQQADKFQVLVIIAPKDENINRLLVCINQLEEEVDSFDDLIKKQYKLKEVKIKENIEILFRHEFVNPKNISRLQLNVRNEEKVNKDQSIGFFEDFEFNTTAQQYIEKFHIAEQYCNSKKQTSNSKERVRLPKAKQNSVAVAKSKKLLDIWIGDIKIYDKLIQALQEDIDIHKQTVQLVKKNKQGSIVWQTTPQKGWQSYLAGFIGVCADKQYIDLNKYSSITLMEICKNTFTTEVKSDDALNKMRYGNLGNRYTEPFVKLFKKLKL